MKKSSETIGNRTRDLLACSAVPVAQSPYELWGEEKIEMIQICVP